MWNLLADAMLAAHVALVLFVVLALPLIVWGNRRAAGARLQALVNGWWFRLAHLATIAVVVAEAWLGITCPLTTWENALRQRGGGSGYAESFIGHWLQRLLFYNAPDGVFTLVYSAFGAAVLAAWWRWPPRRRENAAPLDATGDIP